MPSKKKIINETNTNALSSFDAKKQIKMSKAQIDEINEKVYSAINERELQKSLDKYLKQSNQANQVMYRDLDLLKSIIGEYLDSFIAFGYNIDGDRVILQHFPNPKDRDAIMEFLKIIFFKQQEDNFLD
jgi:hypothetical protein